MAGNEQPGVNAGNSLSRQSSDSIAGIPIKKRRFPLVRPPSPPSQTPSLPVESDLQQKEQSNSKLESSSSNAVGPIAVSEFAATSKNSSEEEKSEHSNLIQGINPPGDNLQEPTLTIAFGSVSEVGNKMGDEFAFQNIAGNTELQLEPKETLVLQKEMKNEGKFVKDDKYNISKMPVNTELLLAPKEMALAAHNIQGIRRDDEKVDPCSWNLGLNEGNNSNDGETKINRTPPRTQRSNWDLNTMMDTWDGSTNDSTVVHVANGLDGLDVAGKCDMKPLIYSTKKVLNESEGTSVTSEKQILEKSEHSPKLSGLSSPDQQLKAGDLLHLSLSTSSGPVCSLGPSPASTNFDSRSVLSSPSFSGKRVPQSSNLKPVGSRTVKSEPSDESNKQDFDIDRRLTSVDFRAVKSEPFERLPQESHKSSNVSILRSLDHGAVKSELGFGDSHETLKTVEGTSRPSECYTFIAERPIDGEALHRSDVTTFTAAGPSTLGLSSPSTFPSTVEISNSVEVASLSEFFACTKGMPSSGVQTQEASETVGEESKVDDANPESARLKLTVEVNVESHVNNDLAGSDEERINLSADMQEDEDYCDTDNESDGNHVVGDVMDSKDDHHGGEDDDYEDGEVREPLMHNDTNYVHAKGEAECADHSEFNDREINVSGFPSDERGTTHTEDGNTKTEGPDETKDTRVSGEFDNIMPNEKHDQCISPVTCLQESVTVEVTATGTEKKKPIEAAQRKPLDHIAREDGLKGQEMELVSDGAPSASQGTSTGGGDQGDTGSQQDNVKGTTTVETKSPISSKTEAPVNVTEAIKDTNSRGNRSRIINLARPFNGSPSSRVRSIPSRPLPSRIERERYNDVVLSGDKLHPRGNRNNDSSIDGGHKFERQRNQDLPVGSTGSDFIHGRGRVDKRLDSPRVDWESDREFAPESCNGPTGFRFAGSKNTGLVSAAKAECSGFIVARVGTIVGAGRGGRKPLNDELPNFGHRPSRVRSPPGGGREGPVSQGVQVVRRPRRDISPGRCIGGGGPDFIGLRHEEKFIRSLPEDMMDPPVFSRPQPQYHRVDDSFTRRDRSFSPIPRRVPINIPRIRSKSPGTRARSPGPWSSPRRSPDGFGHSELTHRRSPPFYRMERMRSPHQRPCFADDLVGRRHGSPPFIPRLSNDMGEMVSTREHERPRSFMPPNRSPSGRILQRGTRRFNVIDRRERTESDEFFGGPMHSGRFHEVGGDGVARIGGERRGPIRSFRPPYNDADVESFRFHVEDGPRTYRLCPEADADFHERGNLREREFERRIKNRPGNPPLRRTRSIEEQEENYRLGGEQGWHDGGLEDVSRVKRRRF